MCMPASMQLSTTDQERPILLDRHVLLPWTPHQRLSPQYWALVPAYCLHLKHQPVR